MFCLGILSGEGGDLWQVNRRVILAGGSGRFSWQDILAGHSGGFIWRVILAPLFGGFPRVMKSKLLSKGREVKEMYKQ